MEFSSKPLPAEDTDGTAYRRCLGELTNTGFLNFVDSISAAVCLALTSIFGTGLRSPVPAIAFSIVLPAVTTFFYSFFSEHAPNHFTAKINPSAKYRPSCDR